LTYLLIRSAIRAPPGTACAHFPCPKYMVCAASSLDGHFPIIWWDAGIEIVYKKLSLLLSNNFF
jgi:hypothetical protein